MQEIIRNANVMDLHQKNYIMLTKEMLNKQISALNPKNTGHYALSVMEDLKLKHLPVVSSNKYSFLLSEKDIFSMDNPGSPIDKASVFSPYAHENTAIIDVLHLMAKDKLSVLPVVGQEGDYLGAVTLDTLAWKLDEISNGGLSGSIIAIEVNSTDYDLSGIARLAESNNAKIVTLFTFPSSGTDRLTVLIKIDLEDASPLLRSLERFNYHVLYYSQKDGLVDEILKKRLDELMFYLKI